MTTPSKEHIVKSLTPYLHFNGTCRAAMAFYRDCFGGELEVTAYADPSGTPNVDPKAPVQHSMLAQGGRALLMASDAPPGSDTPGAGSSCSVFVDCTSDGELETFFTALSQGGTVTVPPSDMPSGRFAMCDDPFGVSWILNCAKAG
jgi:PhnB protein